jgi:hypothetical protein
MHITGHGLLLHAVDGRMQTLVNASGHRSTGGLCGCATGVRFSDGMCGCATGVRFSDGMCGCATGVRFSDGKTGVDGVGAIGLQGSFLIGQRLPQVHQLLLFAGHEWIQSGGQVGTAVADEHPLAQAQRIQLVLCVFHLLGGQADLDLLLMEDFGQQAALVRGHLPGNCARRAATRSDIRRHRENANEQQRPAAGRRRTI